MSLEDDVCRVLESAGRVNLMCCGIRVYGQGYQRLADAIRNGHIHVWQNTNLGGDGASGHYYHAYGPNNRNVLALSYNRVTSLPQKCLVIHEMTHALQDYHRATLNVIDAECAAYVAGAMYSKVMNPSANIYSNGLMGRSPQAATIFAMAQSIATRLIGPPSHYRVTVQEERNLKEYISRHPVYRDQTNVDMQFDGI